MKQMEKMKQNAAKQLAVGKVFVYNFGYFGIYTIGIYFDLCVNELKNYLITLDNDQSAPYVT